MPGSATPKLKQFARQLLDCEAAGRSSASGSAAFRVCEKLRQHLAGLIGVAGVRALFSRALVLASEEARWLSPLEVKPDGSLEGLKELEADLDEKEIAAGEVLLAAELLWLLLTFIGPGLTRRLIQEVWPNVAFDELSL
jgi:hypothetical protein